MVGFKTIMSNAANNFAKRDEVLQLISEKNKIEMDIKLFFDILSTNNIGMHEPLVDREGFPRNDIDVYQVRTARNKIICLQNDHKSIMAKIESGLHHLHAGGSEAVSPMEEDSVVGPSKEPFARVTLVTPTSPADVCGLKAGDLVLEFGSVNKTNFKSIQDVATVVSCSVGQKVNVTVKREGRHALLSLDLVPQMWSGRGLLGCKIDPLPGENIER